MRAAEPADLLVSAVLQKLTDDSDRRQRERAAAFVGRLSPGQAALLRHLTGLEVLSQAELHELDDMGPALNESAQAVGVTAATGVAELVRRDEQGEWQLHHGAKRAIRAALAEID